MKKALIIGILGTILPLSATAQQDTIERNVVVEREFQPVIRHAGKLNTPLQQVETKIEPVELQFSDYSKPLDASFNVKPLGVSPIRFTHSKQRNGHLTLGGGYPLSFADFEYQINHKQWLQLKLFGTHEGQWGVKTLSESNLGLNLQASLEAGKIYFQVDGNNVFYTRYGRYFAGDKQLSISRFNQLTEADKQNLWTINSDLGFHSSFESAFQIRVDAGYTAFIIPNVVTENIVRSHLWLGWQEEAHTVAFNIRGRNAFMAVNEKTKLDESEYNPRHCIRFEPYYGYNADNWNIHAGVNIDMNIGKGKLLSANNDLSFAPSPNVEVEYRIIPSWLAVYGKAKGEFGYGTEQDFMMANAYRNPILGITSHHVAAYTPIDASIGFKIKPTSGLMLDLYGGFARMNNQTTLCAPAINDHSRYPYINYFYSDYRRWKAGAEITYHYQDIVHFLLAGNYYHWTMVDFDVESFPPYLIKEHTQKQPYDRPAWDAHFRIDVNINSKWTVYSDNIAFGKRKVLLTDDKVPELKPTIDLRLGVRYNMNRWLSFYGQLNNYLHRFNDIYYGYQSQGINGEIGLSWMF